MTEEHAQSSNTMLAAGAWIWVGVPFAYGLVQLFTKIPALFSS